MSVAITNTHNTMGVRHLNGLRTRSFKANRPGLTGYITLGSLGDAVDPDTISALAAAGYNPITLQSLQAQGASDQQLLALPFGPGTTADDMGAGVYALQVQLGGAPPPVNVPMNYSSAGFLYDPMIASGGPIGTLEQASQPGVNAQALQFAAGPLGTALTPGPGSPSAPSLFTTASSAAASNLSTAFSSPQNFLQWLEANALWIALLAGAAIVLPPLIKKL